MNLKIFHFPFSIFHLTLTGLIVFLLVASFLTISANEAQARCYWNPGCSYPCVGCWGGPGSECEGGWRGCCEGSCRVEDCSRARFYCCNENNWQPGGNCNVSCGSGSQLWQNDCGDTQWRGCNAGVCNSPPVLSSVTINSPTVKPDNATTYNVAVTASDATGASDIRGLYALVNYQGTNQGQYRGYLMWHQNQTHPSMKDHRACSGGGFGNIYSSGYGDSYLRLDACSVDSSGNDRTASFSVRFDPSFTTPSTNNDLSGYTFDAAGATNGWTNYDINFSLILTGTLNVSTAPGSIQPSFSVKNSGGSVVGSGAGPGPVAFTLSSGAYTVEFLPFSGYTTPGPQSVNLGSGQTLSVSGNYTASPGTLSVRTLPFNAGISVDGNSWGNAPQSRTVSVGTHTVVFADVAGYITPPPRNPVVSSNQTTTIIETYNRGEGVAPSPDRLLFQSIFVWREVAP